MSFKSTLFAAVAALTFTGAVQAEDMAGKIVIMDPYARTSMMAAETGAAFMILENRSDADDRLISASSDIAERVELHTHIEDADGVMQMREVEDGFVIPAGGMHALERGGDHVMFLGLKQPLADGDTVSLTLTFETAGDMVVEVPVDLTRKPGHGKMMHKMGTDG
ncbi:copper chaperone PCu(A)C [Sedimentitalea sp. JM2-8]|uniref:Copper chaperone PCu(A)C n=1 Tax=Sedimentitalea xiamensis TaxID=3050037 RepID=A0ABT7FL27_9RHOB|nr:copper chaperone PCu(A)C [Sedimentitalea xiamensis]MDK3075859.1 copper chaperone PCu(A)C [Sedimentitalea xiamensis]